MPKKVIDFYDSVEFSGDWDFVKQKKERIKIKTEKAVNSEIYVTFNDVVPLYTFLYFALAPEEAFGFQKVQPIFEKMMGDNEESRQQFEQVRKSMSLNWNGVTPLPELIREHKKHIIREQKNIYNISQRITEQDAKMLLRSGLSQRKIHLDFHTNDGEEETAIIPTIENINNCITIIHEKSNGKYLLAFFAHIQKEQQKAQEEHKIQYETHNQPETMKDRPLPTKEILNPDDRLLPIPPREYRESEHTIHANQRQPNFQRDIKNPDEKLLTPPAETETDRQRSKSPNIIVNPDQRLLPFPPKADPREARKIEQKPMRQQKVEQKQNTMNNQNISTSKATEIKAEIKHMGEVAENKMHQIGEKAIDFGKKIEGKAEEVIEDIKNDKGKWVQLGISAFIIGMAIKALRS